ETKAREATEAQEEALRLKGEAEAAQAEAEAAKIQAETDKVKAEQERNDANAAKAEAENEKVRLTTSSLILNQQQEDARAERERAQMELEKDQAITQLATANRQKNTLQTKLDQIETIIGTNPTNAQLQNLVDNQRAVNHSGQSLDDIRQLHGKNITNLVDKEAELNTIAYFLTDLRDASGIIDSTKLQDYQKSIRFYNNDLSRLKKQTERVLNRFRNDQGINNNDLNNSLSIGG